MGTFGKRAGLGTLLLLAVGFTQAIPTHALPTTVNLTTWDDPYLDASTDKVAVTISYAGAGRNATTTVRFDWIGGNSGLTATEIEKVAWNSNAKILDCADGWTCGGKGKMDGFGLFQRTASNGGHDDLTATFVLKGKVHFGINNFGPKGKGHAQFAALVDYEGCSAYASNAGARFGGKHDHGCGGAVLPITSPVVNGGVHHDDDHRDGGQSVPEPASLMLLGAGLAGVGLWGRRSARR